MVCLFLEIRNENQNYVYLTKLNLRMRINCIVPHNLGINNGNSWGGWEWGFPFPELTIISLSYILYLLNYPHLKWSHLHDFYYQIAKPLKPNHQRTSQNKPFVVVLLPSLAPHVFVASTPSTCSWPTSVSADWKVCFILLNFCFDSLCTSSSLCFMLFCFSISFVWLI